MTSTACIKMSNRFVNTNEWTGAVKYVIYVHYDTILTHTTQGDAKPHPPYDDRIITRRAAGFSCNIATQHTRLSKGYRRYRCSHSDAPCP